MSSGTSRIDRVVAAEEQQGQQTNEDGHGTLRDGDPARERKTLEEAGWGLVEKDTRKVLWRNPASGRLYPQRAAAKLVREVRAPKGPDGA